jgi:hypothetical protein
VPATAVSVRVTPSSMITMIELLLLFADLRKRMAAVPLAAVVVNRI